MTQKHTHETFVQKMQSLHGNEYDLISRFESYDNKVKILHKTCGYSWKKSAKAALIKHYSPIFCPSCREELRQINSMIEIKQQVYELVKDEYLILETKKQDRTVTFKHNIMGCGHTYKAEPCSFISQGHRCSKCAGVAKKTHKEFLKEVSSLTGNDYEVMSTYTNTTTPVLMKHTICDKTFEVTPNKFIYRNKRCHHCRLEGILGKHNFKTRVKEVHGDNYLVLDEFIATKTAMRIKHVTDSCGEIFVKTPAQFILNKQECPCVSRKKTKELYTNKFIKKLHASFGNDYTLISEYKTIVDRVEIKHNKCGLTFYPIPTVMFRDHQECPFCFEGSSKGETKIYRYLKENKIKFFTQHYFDDCRHINPLRFDFAVPLVDGRLILIEYDGIQHFSPVDFAGKGEEWALEEHLLTKERDEIKNDYARRKGIKLIRIPYSDYDYAEKILNDNLFDKPVVKDGII